MDNNPYASYPNCNNTAMVGFELCWREAAI